MEKKNKKKYFFLKRRKLQRKTKQPQIFFKFFFDDYNVSYKYAYFGHQGEPTPIMVPLPFWVRPLSGHIKPKKC